MFLINADRGLMKNLLLLGFCTIAFQSYAMEKEQKLEKPEKENLKPYRKEVTRILSSKLSPKTKTDMLYKNLTLSSRESDLAIKKEIEEKKNENADEVDINNLAEGALIQCNLQGDPELKHLFAERLKKMKTSGSSEDQKTLAQIREYSLGKK